MFRKEKICFELSVILSLIKYLLFVASAICFAIIVGMYTKYRDQFTFSWILWFAFFSLLFVVFHFLEKKMKPK
jgi:hypothetical protein